MPETTISFFTKHQHHWRARAHIKKEFKEIFVAEMISITGGLLAGTLIATHINQLLLIPGLLILLPGFLEMRGNISGALSARLGTALDLHWIPARIRGNKIISQNIIATFIEALVVALVLATVAYIVTLLVFGAASPNIFPIAIIAALTSNIIEVTLTTYATFWLFKKGHDPNNIMGPYVTTTGDVISIFSLLFAILIVT